MEDGVVSHSESRELVYWTGDRRHVGTFVPAVEEPRALAVLLPDWRGRSALAFDHASHLASLGCAVLVADLYGDGLNPSDPEQVAPMVQHLLTHRAEGVAALSAAVRAARREAPGALPVLTVGFSAGAVAALDHARQTREAAAVAVCSGLLKSAEPGTPTHVEAPILLVQGTQDEVSPIAVLADLVAEADAVGNDLRLLLLSQTHHAYDNPDAGTDPAARLMYSGRSAARMRRALATLVDEVTEGTDGSARYPSDQGAASTS
jgi:dienelactone hydrolase